jgi:DNA-binding transcriptional LysR family regulator
VLSRRLGALEQRLGIRLVERTTRQLRFTDEGERLAERLRHASRLIDEAEQEAALGAAQVRGRLRLALPAAMGRRWLSGLLADFVLAHPQVTIDAEYADRFVDLVGEGFDAAIRIGELADNRLVASKLCDTCASSAPRLATWHAMARRSCRRTWPAITAWASVGCVRSPNGTLPPRADRQASGRWQPARQ